MDSGAFTEISTHGFYRFGPETYALEVRRWASCGNLLAAVSQDFMCEAHILEKTGLSISRHQELTILRFEQIRSMVPPSIYVMPVIQGFHPDDYARHVRAYGDMIEPGSWVGVGSVCKRNGDPRAIESVLMRIKEQRPDILLHGFGIKAKGQKLGKWPIWNPVASYSPKVDDRVRDMRSGRVGFVSYVRAPIAGVRFPRSDGWPFPALVEINPASLEIAS